MRKFCAKLYGRWNNHVIIFDTEQKINQLNEYKIPNIGNSKEFNPDESCDDDEWYFVEFTEEQKSQILGEFYTVIGDTTALNPITPQNYKKALWLYLVNSENRTILFTRITKKYILWEHKIMTFYGSWDTILEANINSIQFNEQVDAYFDWNNKLYFKNYSKIRWIFRWFEVFYNEATEDEKNEFLQNTFFINLLWEVNSVKLGSRSLRKISYINSLWIDFTDATIRTSYMEYASEYTELWIKVVGNQLKFENDKDINNILYLLTESCYTTPVTWRKKLAQASTNM